MNTAIKFYDKNHLFTAEIYYKFCLIIFWQLAHKFNQKFYELSQFITKNWQFVFKTFNEFLLTKYVHHITAREKI